MRPILYDGLGQESTEKDQSFQKMPSVKKRFSTTEFNDPLSQLFDVRITLAYSFCKKCLETETSID